MQGIRLSKICIVFDLRFYSQSAGVVIKHMFCFHVQNILPVTWEPRLRQILTEKKKKNFTSLKYKNKGLHDEWIVAPLTLTTSALRHLSTQ